MIRDDFNKSVKDTLKLRSAFICSNPDCKKLTVAPANEDKEKLIILEKLHSCF
jgi:hypothetical protein